MKDGVSIRALAGSARSYLESFGTDEEVSIRALAGSARLSRKRTQKRL